METCQIRFCNVKVFGNLCLSNSPFLSLHISFAAIRDGYKLEFDSEPPSSLLPNNKSARERPDFVLAEVARLEKLGCILKVIDRPRIVNPLSVVCEFHALFVCLFYCMSFL